MAIGAGALLISAAVSFDLYTRVAASAAGGHAAIAMADYVTRESAPERVQMEALGQYLHRHHMGAPADLVIVVSAIRREPGPDPAQVLWVETFEIPLEAGDTSVTAELAADCGRFGAAGGPAKFDIAFDMGEGEAIVVTELCARLSSQGALTSLIVAGDIYRIVAFPPRDPSLPPPVPA